MVDDRRTVAIAQTFGVPVVTSETGAEILSDRKWVTYFIINNFSGPIFEAIHKSIHE